MLELDESIEDGLVREVLEETGLLIRPLRLTGVYKNMVRGIVTLVFRCEVVQREATVSDEVAEIAWLSAVKVAERMEEATRSACSTRSTAGGHRCAATMGVFSCRLRRRSTVEGIGRPESRLRQR